MYRASLSIILTIIFGQRVESSDSISCRLLDDHTRSFTEYTNAASIRLVDFVPSIRKLPSWIPLNREFDRVKTLQDKAFYTFYNVFEAGLLREDSNSSQSFLADIKRRQEDLGFTSEKDLV
jgi:hypothetical protein